MTAYTDAVRTCGAWYTHFLTVSAFTMIGEPLLVASVDGTTFFANCGHLAERLGLPIADAEGRVISEALGSNNALLLAHHGLLTAGTTIEEAATLAI